MTLWFMIWYDMIENGLVWHKLEWHDEVLGMMHGTIWYGMV